MLILVMDREINLRFLQWIVLIFISLLHSSTSQFDTNHLVLKNFKLFCAQFYARAEDRTPKQYDVKEDTNVGHLIAEFERPRHGATVVFDEGHTDILHYSPEDFTFKIIKSVREKRGQTLHIRGTCYEKLPIYEINMDLEVRLEVVVADVNDPPVFTNLPDSVQTPESVPIRRTIYRVAADDPYDVVLEFTRRHFSLLNVTSPGAGSEGLELFSVDRAGNVFLLSDLDYELGPREYSLSIQVEDEGVPVQRNTSILRVLVQDSDDMDPKFTTTHSRANVIGEKPIPETVCFSSDPPLLAVDQDLMIKATINYKITQGYPSDWPNFFRLEQDTAKLCQLEEIPRSLKVPGTRILTFHNYTFVIEAYQTDAPEKTDQATLEVQVRDQNTYVPAFRRLLYRTTIPEYPTLKRDADVITVQATDEDYGINKLFEYRLTKNPKNAFIINRKSGVIRVIRPSTIDRELNETLELWVEAVETASQKRLKSEIDARVSITISDVNDNAPKFTKYQYRYEVKDIHPVGTPIHSISDRVLAEDPDFRENGTVQYRITSVTDDTGRFSIRNLERFFIDEEGVIRLGKSLRDLRRKRNLPSYNLQVKAEDQAEQKSSRRTATAQVRIQVVEGNDFAPEFTEGEYRATLKEDTETGTVILAVKATDKDGDSDLYLDYSIIDGNEGNAFTITNRGSIVTTRKLDTEGREFYKLKIQVTDGEHKSYTTATIFVEDMNDHEPFFKQEDYTFKIQEDVASGYHIGDVIASDRDVGENGELVHSIISGDRTDLFHIHKNGSLFLSRQDPGVDREQREKFTLIIQARDSGYIPKSNQTRVHIVLLDVNDNAPKFSQAKYVGEVVEGMPASQQQHQIVKMRVPISATDADKTKENRNVLFSLKGSGSDQFVIEPRSGAVSVKKMGSLDCETQCQFNLQVLAIDKNGKGLESEVDLVIEVGDVNDNAPEIPGNYSFRISPVTRIGATIGKIQAVDRDQTSKNNRVMYLLKAGGYGKFALHFDSGELTVIDDLLREPLKKKYDLEIHAYDTGQPRLTSKTKVKIVVPVNRPPVLPETYRFKVVEDQAIGTVIVTMEATDPDLDDDTDEKLIYSVKDENVPFTIEPNTGVISTSKLLDAEKQQNWEFYVLVEDSGIPVKTASTHVTVFIMDINDNAPVFDSAEGYTGRVLEDNDSPGKTPPIIHMMRPISASDADISEKNSKVSYSLAEGHKLFSIHPTTGRLSVLHAGLIDCEKAAVYNLSVIATDRGTPGHSASVLLTIAVDDVNDQSPVFRRPWTFDAGRMDAVGTKVGRLRADDKDCSSTNNHVLYILKAGAFGMFSLDAEKGVIHVANDLTRAPMKSVYKLDVVAMDTGNPPKSTNMRVKIRVRLNSPPKAKARITYTVAEDIKVGTQLGSIQVTDRDLGKRPNERLTYYIKDDIDAFQIDKNDGIIVSTRPLDRESNDKYTLTVYVMDNGAPVLSTTSFITVIVTDVNDNAPIFGSDRGYRGTVTEDNSSPIENQEFIVIPQITISDADSTEENREVVISLDGEGSDLFTVDQSDMSVKIKKAGTIDCERKCHYDLKLVATDRHGSGMSTESDLHIYVQDTNDNVPVFDEPIWRFETDPQSDIGATIGRVSATDADISSTNRRLIYLLRGGGYGKFALNPETGEITVADSLTREPLLNTYSLDIEAQDAGVPRLSASSKVVIAVPVNHPPVFDMETRIEALEDTKVGSIVGQLYAIDDDVLTKKSERLEYFLQTKSAKICRVQPTVPFQIHADNGEIRTKTTLDAEEVSSYEFPVFARDNGQPSYTASTTLTILVKNVNDNPPVFQSTYGYHGRITEDDSNPIEKQLVKLNKPIVVSDPDDSKDESIGEIRLHLEGEGSELFSLDHETREIRVMSAGSIDCEERCSFNLTLVALDSDGDKSFTAKTHLYIAVDDINDHAPRFSGAYSFHAGRHSHIGATLGQIEAVDEDEGAHGTVIYILKSGGAGKFSIHPNSGVVTVTDELSREPARPVYKLIVEAYDMGMPQKSSSTTVHIYVAKNAPPEFRIREFIFHAREDIGVGTEIATVQATDPDIGKREGEVLRYTMSEDSQEEPFNINSADGIIKIAKPLDAELVAEHILHVLAVDNGVPQYTATATVTVFVDDVNEEPPHFDATSGYTGTVIEDDASPVVDQKVVVTPMISAHDGDVSADKGIVFQLSGNGSELFVIDSSSGQIMVSTPGRLDADQQNLYQLQITATDQDGAGMSSKADLTIHVTDVNDNAPEVFGGHVLKTGRGTAVGSVVGAVSARDGDVSPVNNKLMYILCNGGFQKFAVDMYTGEITVSADLSREPVHEEYKLTVDVYDIGQPQHSTTTDVFIRVPKNNPPEVEPRLTFRIDENVPIDTVIGSIPADDPDLGRVPGEKLHFTSREITGPFYLDDDTGELVMSGSVNYETNTAYKFDVEVTDMGVPKQTAMTTVTIVIEDVNDNAPQFGSLSGYEGRVTEDNVEPIRHQRVLVMPAVTSMDADSSPAFRAVSYSLKGEGSHLFNIDPLTAEIKVKYAGSIDAEDKDEYLLHIVAENKDESRLRAEVPLTIHVQDQNDNAPEVPNLLKFAISRGVAIGTVIGKLVAHDVDVTVTNNRVMFSLKQGGAGKFAVQATSGEITVASPLTRDLLEAEYEMVVVAYDTGYPQLSASTTVIISVPLNAKPELIDEYEFNVPESNSPDMEVGTVSAYDADLEHNPKERLTYHILVNNAPFKIGESTGVIKTTSSLDYETMARYTFKVYVKDNGAPSFTATATIIVNVLDMNDHAPEFNSPAGYMAYITEDDRDPVLDRTIQLIPTLVVSDKDSHVDNRRVKLELEGHGSDLYSINSETGELSVKQPGKIDCEVRCQFDLKIVATDQDGTGLQSVSSLRIIVEDANDNAPEFTNHEYNFTVAPSSPPSTVVGMVTAHDPDVTTRNSRVIYGIMNGSDGDFVIDMITGQITVTSSLGRKEVDHDYSLIVTAMDTGDRAQTGTTTVHITVPVNHRPVAPEELEISVTENIPIDTEIGRVSAHDVDVDKGIGERLIYFMDERSDVPFIVDKDDGSIHTTSVLDAESETEYKFLVHVKDTALLPYNTSTKVVVFLEDVNDNAPEFLLSGRTGYMGSVLEDDVQPIDNQPVFIFPPVFARDKDNSEEHRRIVYSLLGDTSDVFAINRTSGDITVRKPGTIDCETVCLYNLKVIATDQGGSGLSTEAPLTVTVQDVNDNPPVLSMTAPTYDIPSGTSVGTVIGQVAASDRDSPERNGHLTYLLKSGGYGKFHVDTDTGDILVADLLGREPLKNIYMLGVEVYDSGVPRRSVTGEVTINVPTNHAPTIEPRYQFTIPENVPVSTLVGKIVGQDPDLHEDPAEKLSYFITDSEVPFRIAAKSGLLSTASPLDRELTTGFTFHVFVHDNGSPQYTASTTVTVLIDDVNDNLPVFTSGDKYTGMIYEDDVNKKPKQVVQMNRNITVVDLDATEINRNVRLYLEGQHKELFHLDSRTGTMTTAQPGQIDREKHKEFNLKIVARDRWGRGHQSEVAINILVLDENDNSPVFTSQVFQFIVPADVHTDYEVGHVRASDYDATSPNNRVIFIIEKDPLGKFRLDSNTGRISVLESFFSKPRREKYEFSVTAMDMGHPIKRRETRVVIHAPELMYNDYPPVFKGRSVFYLEEEVPIGSVVGQLNVVDQDQSRNKTNVKFTIIQENHEPVPFTINSRGEILTSGRIDHDSGKQYYLFRVLATDEGAPPFNASQDIGIIVRDINDNPPVFPLKVYRHMVFDLFPPKTIVSTPIAFDTVDMRNSRYKYSLIGDKPGYFEIDDTTAVVRTTDRLMELGEETLVFTITARDVYQPQLTATTSLEVKVIDSKGTPQNSTCCCIVPC